MGAGAPHVFRYALRFGQAARCADHRRPGMEPLSTFAQSLVELHVSHEQSEEIHRQAREAAKERLHERIERLCAKENNGDLEGCRVTGIRIVEGQPA